MWQEYFDFVSAGLAVINGLIAITIGLLPVRRSVLKLRLGAAALVLGALAVAATFYGTYRAYVQLERQQSVRAEIRKELDSFTAEGQALLEQIGAANRELPTRAADEWAQQAEIFLRNRLGEHAVARFRREANTLYGDDSHIAAARIGYWRAVRDRVVNLEAINAEFAGQTAHALTTSR